MNDEIKEIIDSLEDCIGMFDYMITPIESNLLVSYIRELQQENQKYKEVIDKAIELLCNYKHYSTPDEKQNGDNEDLVNNAFDILKEIKYEKRN